ncbi:apolipoprotein N-acyltransferase [Halioxenophilus sp. WMMB6]|uniref:apolipoprotein N-acyltransferase n=1 Tax=Halioxenophilus sp. WMMB6 TaxID=3073815 RepID=UPI00295F5468|nr:apolipoprotein N-acyltransferase [Halioxenophilus sp. WMMB6]
MTRFARLCAGCFRPQTLLLLLANLVTGGLVPLSLAPFDYWPAGLLGVALFNTLLTLQTRGHFWSALAFGCGLFGVGASWVYVSIHGFGMASTALALLLTSLFVGGLALVFALPYCFWQRFRSTNLTVTLTVVAPLFWLFGEWLRGWLLTGFPWLYLGYGHLHTPLAGLAPVGGVLLVGWAVAVTGSGLVALGRLALARRWPAALGLLTALMALWLSALGMVQVEWTKPAGNSKTVALVQPNIPQELKWAPAERLPTLRLLQSLSDPLWPEVDWIVWPEAALPMLYENAVPFLNDISQRAAANNAALITGVLYRAPDTGEIHNSIIARGIGQGLYSKSRLVPFGEYVPLGHWLRGLLDFFNMPTSIIAPSHGAQPNLLLGDTLLSADICYEVAYPALIARHAQGANVLLTISNDAWFGDSIGPLQHMQMAQMRALETGRDLIRATNNGISALVDHQGDIRTRLPQFERRVLIGEVVPRAGITPYMLWRNNPLIGAMALAFLALAWRARTRNRDLHADKKSLAKPT